MIVKTTIYIVFGVVTGLAKMPIEMWVFWALLGLLCAMDLAGERRS